MITDERHQLVRRHGVLRIRLSVWPRVRRSLFASGLCQSMISAGSRRSGLEGPIRHFVCQTERYIPLGALLCRACAGYPGSVISWMSGATSN